MQVNALSIRALDETAISLSLRDARFGLGNAVALGNALALNTGAFPTQPALRNPRSLPFSGRSILELVTQLPQTFASPASPRREQLARASISPRMRLSDLDRYWGPERYQDAKLVDVASAIALNGTVRVTRGASYATDTGGIRDPARLFADQASISDRGTDRGIADRVAGEAEPFRESAGAPSPGRHSVHRRPYEREEDDAGKSRARTTAGRTLPQRAARGLRRILARFRIRARPRER